MKSQRVFGDLIFFKELSMGVLLLIIATYFQKTFSWEHLWKAATEALRLNRTCSDGPAKITRTLIGIILIWRNDCVKRLQRKKDKKAEIKSPVTL